MLMSNDDKQKLSMYEKQIAELKKELEKKLSTEDFQAILNDANNIKHEDKIDFDCNTVARYDSYNNKYLGGLSKILIKLGLKFYGNPVAWKVDCPPEEFYCLPHERPLINKVTLSKQGGGNFDGMKRNLYINTLRQKVAQDSAKAATTIGLTISGAFIALVIVAQLTLGGVSMVVHGGTRLVKNTYYSMTLPEDKKLQKELESVKEEARAYVESATENGVSEDKIQSKMEKYEKQFVEINEKLQAINNSKQAQIDAEAKAKAEAESKARTEQEAKEKAEAEAKQRAEAEKARIEAQATPAPAPTPVVAQVAPTPTPAVAPQVAQPVATPAPVASQPKPTPAPTPEVVAKPAKPKMSDSEKASLKAKYMSQFQGGQISKDEMLSKIKQLNNQ